MFPLLSLGLFAVAPSAIDWQAPPQCPSIEVLEARIARLRDVDGADDPQLQAVAKVRHDETGWVLSLHITHRGRVEERSLHGDSCHDVTDAAALILAVALDEAASSAPALPATPAPTRDPSPPPSRSPPAAAAPTNADPTTRRRPAVALRGNIRVGVGRLPAPDAALLLGPSVRWRRAVIDAWVSAFVPAVALHPTQSIDARMFAITAGLRAGACWNWQRIEVGVYGAIEGGPIHVRGLGSGLASPTSDFTGWVGLGPQGSLGWQASPAVTLVLDLEVMGAVLRPQARVRDQPAFWTGVPVAVAAGLGVRIAPRVGRRRNRPNRGL